MLSVNQSGVDNEVIGQLAAVMGRKHLTKLPTFAGDEKEWAYFEVVFNRTTIEGRYTEADNIARLREALRQPALTFVQSQLMYPTSASEVTDSLREFYGRPEKVIHAHMQSLMDFDCMQREDDPKIREFAVAIKEYVAIIRSLEREHELMSE